MFVAITGTIGAGKSSVTNLIAKQGYRTYDTDKMVHAYYEQEGVLYEPVLELLGLDILDDQNNICRDKMAKILFDQKYKLNELESMVFSQVKKDLKDLRKEYENEAVFVEVPLLFEAKLETMFERIIVVDAKLDLRLERLVNKGIQPSDALKRMSHQYSPEKKRAAADYIIENNSSLADLNEEVVSIINLIALERARSWINPNTQ